MGASKTDILRALAGNQQAMKSVARQGLRRYHDKLNSLDQELRRHQQQTWDREAQREWALDPETEVSPEAFEAVWDAINDRVLTLILGTITLIHGDPQASQAAEREMRSTAFELFLLIGNPEARYNLIAGLRPELREIAEQQMEDFGREVWGSLIALTEDESDAANFPPDTEANIRELARQRAEFLEQYAEEAADG